jgi:transcriptional regulator with XRE-family HTH domain
VERLILWGMTDRIASRRTTNAQRIADRRAAYLVRRVGIALREARVALRLPQRVVAARAGISQAHWSRIERGLEHGAALDTLAACAAAVDTQLAAFIEAMPGADLPRDIEHLRRQALIVEIARSGGWTATPEAPVPTDGPRPRSIDVLLMRDARHEAAVVEIWDLILDGGGAMRGLEAKALATRERLPPGWRAEGLLVVRGTQRNRALVRELAPLFAARYPASSALWIAALVNADRPMPSASGLAWTSVAGDRLVAARIV